MSVDYPGERCDHCGSSNVQVHVSACCQVMICRDCGHLAELRYLENAGPLPHSGWQRNLSWRRRRSL